MSSRTSSRLLLLLTALLFSTGGAGIKAAAVTPWQVACLRSLVAAAALWLMMPLARRGWNRRTLLVGLAYAATLVLFVLSNRMTTAANAIFLQSTAPVYLLFIAPVLLKEPIRRADVALALAVGLGMSLLFLAPQEVARTAPRPLLGNVLALLSGLTFALTVSGLRWQGRHGAKEGGAGATVIVGNLLAAALALPGALPLSAVAPADLAILGYLGVFQIGLAYLCLTRGLRDVPAFEASTLLLLEPVLNPCWTWLVHGERPAGLALAGGAIILAATLASTWWKTRAGNPTV